MGRSEKDLDPDSPYASFAGGLRALRKSAGLTLDDLAGKTNFGKSVLSTAQGGEFLPTWPVTKAYVEECGGNLAEWHSRWKRAQASCKSSPSRNKDADGPYRGSS
jgi:transcriptional regulator with XRE-family HTH domain